MEDLRIKQVHQVNDVRVEEVCALCECPGHPVTACPAFQNMKEAYQNNQAEVNAVNQRWDPYSNTYNPGWAHHPNLSWRDPKVPVPPQAPPQQQMQPYQPPQGQMTHQPPQGQMAPYRYSPQNQQGSGPSFSGPPPGINHPPRERQTDEMLKALIQSQLSFTEQTKQAIGDIRSQLTQLTAVVGQIQQERGRFPSQPHTNAAGTNFLGDSSGTSSANPRLEEAKAITTLRSGKVIDQTIPPKQKPAPPPELVAAPKVVPEKEKESESPEVVVPTPVAPTTPLPPVAPYPHRLVAKPSVNVNFQILELFKKVQFPMSLMEAIDAIPQFAKVLKELCTSKRRTRSRNNVVLTEQVSSILQADIPLKRKDPGCPTIPIAIAGQSFDKALLDLGASVNLLPYSVYQELGIGDLKATPVTLQLADRSVRIPKGVVEDVLIQVGEFLFPVDFIVLDTCPIPGVLEKTPIILGRPFLATSSAVMNCKTGQVQFSFGDLKMEVNVYNVDSRVEDNAEVYEVSLIDTLVQEPVENVLCTDPLEIALTAKEALFFDSPGDPVLEPLGAPLSRALPSSVQALF